MLCDHSSLIYQELVYVWGIADIHKVVDIADILASEGCKHCVAIPPVSPRSRHCGRNPSFDPPRRTLLLQSMLCQLCVATTCNACRRVPIAHSSVPRSEAAGRSAECNSRTAAKPAFARYSACPTSTTDAPLTSPTQRRKKGLQGETVCCAPHSWSAVMRAHSRPL